MDIKKRHINKSPSSKATNNSNTNEGKIKSPKKLNTKHYLATEMGLNNVSPKKMKRKKSPPVRLDEMPNILKQNLGYEHRTVNSIADVTVYTANDPGIPKKKPKRLKPEYIDSEVDLMKTRPLRPPINLSMLMPKNTLPAIQEHKSENDVTPGKNKKNRKRKSKPPSQHDFPDRSEMTKISSVKVKNTPKVASVASAQIDPAEKYPVLKNHDLVKKFLNVDLNNNQKGRIRQVIKDILRGTSSTTLPDVINNKMQAILKSKQNLTDTDLRKLRILYNMLKKSTEVTQKPPDDTDSEDIFKNKRKEIEENESTVKDDSKDKQKRKETKPKKEKVAKDTAGIKRYVVFLGNLPINITREQILNHFPDIREYIKDVRIPQLADDKKSCIAYVEFDNAPVYEMALSRHHSMMANRRINVLYTTPNKNSKISKTEAKAKSAKLMAMAKKGQLIGSIPLHKKRSQRRAKARAYQRAAEKELNSVDLS